MGSCTIYLHSLLTARAHVPGALWASDTTFCYTYIVYSNAPQKSRPKFAQGLEPPGRKERQENTKPWRPWRLCGEIYRYKSVTTASRTGQSPPRATPSPHTAAPWPPPATSPCRPTGRTSEALPPPASPAARKKPPRPPHTPAGQTPHPTPGT